LVRKEFEAKTTNSQTWNAALLIASLANSLLRARAIEFNREHRNASMNASMWRLRFAVVVSFGALVFLAGRALAGTNSDAPTGKPHY
jgi:hypothetical protein